MASGARVSYRVFGHVVVADSPIGGLSPWNARDRRRGGGPDAAIDVRLQAWPPRLRRPVRPSQRPIYVSPFRDAHGVPALVAYRRAGGALWQLQMPDGTTCAVDQNGQRIWLRWPDTVIDAEEFLLGTGLGFAMRLRGDLCLHAAAIEVDGQAVLLAGPPGAGKSTLAVLLGARPHAIVTDDVAVIRRRDGTFVVEPGPMRVRLRRDAVPMLRRRLGRNLALHPSPGGAFVDLALGSQAWLQPRTAVPIDAIYLLSRPSGRSTRVTIREMSRADALVTLVADSWAARLQPPASRRREFEAVSALLSAIPVRRVVAGRGSLRRVRDLILSDLSGRRSIA